jgi:hypothetical protein
MPIPGTSASALGIWTNVSVPRVQNLATSLPQGPSQLAKQLSANAPRPGNSVLEQLKPVALAAIQAPERFSGESASDKWVVLDKSLRPVPKLATVSGQIINLKA